MDLFNNLSKEQIIQLRKLFAREFNKPEEEVVKLFYDKKESPFFDVATRTAISLNILFKTKLSECKTVKEAYETYCVLLSCISILLEPVAESNREGFLKFLIENLDTYNNVLKIIKHGKHAHP